MLPIAFVIGLVVVSTLLLRTQPRRYYFIRHGETLMNEKHIRQGPEGALSETGRHQAEQVGEYLKHFPIERIVSSTYPRARETAEIIRTYLKVPVIYSALLVERKNPSEIIGKSTHDPDVIRIVDEMDLAYHADDFRFSDEENFADLKIRGQKCVDLLARQGARDTAVVTHHGFLKMIVAYMLYRERLNAADFVKLSFYNVSDNAGITICEYHPWKMFSATRGWTVVTYNQSPTN